MDKELSFENFQNRLNEQPSFTTSQVGVLMESCVTCCNLQKKNSGSLLKCFDDKRNLYKVPYTIVWNSEFTERLKKAYKDEKKATENAAVFLSLSLMLELTDYKYFEVTEGNNGIDYWLSNESDDLDFSARLEISGIRQEKQSNNINTRLNTKINQTKRSDSSTLPAYIAIIEFSKLEAIILER
jgi:hypothetical protein